MEIENVQAALIFSILARGQANEYLKNASATSDKITIFKNDGTSVPFSAYDSYQIRPSDTDDEYEFCEDLRGDTIPYDVAWSALRENIKGKITLTLANHSLTYEYEGLHKIGSRVNALVFRGTYAELLYEDAPPAPPLADLNNQYVIFVKSTETTPATYSVTLHDGAASPQYTAGAGIGIDGSVIRSTLGETTQVEQDKKVYELTDLEFIVESGAPPAMPYRTEYADLQGIDIGLSVPLKCSAVKGGSTVDLGYGVLEDIGDYVPGAYFCSWNTATSPGEILAGDAIIPIDESKPVIVWVSPFSGICAIFSTVQHTDISNVSIYQGTETVTLYNRLPEHAVDAGAHIGITNGIIRSTLGEAMSEEQDKMLFTVVNTGGFTSDPDAPPTIGYSTGVMPLPPDLDLSEGMTLRCNIVKNGATIDLSSGQMIDINALNFEDYVLGEFKQGSYGCTFNTDTSLADILAGVTPTPVNGEYPVLIWIIFSEDHFKIYSTAAHSDVSKITLYQTETVTSYDLLPLTALEFDSAPTVDSSKLLTSGAVYDAIGDVYDAIGDVSTVIDAINDLIGGST